MAWLYKRGDKWWLGWRIGDTQFLKSTGETERSEAKKQLEAVQRLEIAQKASALTEDYYRAATGKPMTRVSVSDFFKTWLADSESVTTKSTMNKYRQVAREFCSHVEAEATGLLVENVTVEQLNSFFNLKRKQLAPGTVKGYRRILSSIFITAQNQGKIKGNPVALSKGRTGAGEDSNVKKRPFTLIELTTLYSKANPFWRYMLTAGFYTGQSLGDLITLRVEAVDLKAGLITLNRRKSGRQVIVPISKELRQSLVVLWPKDGNDYFWPEQAVRYLRTGASSFSQEFYALMASVGLVRARDDKQKISGLGRDAKRAPQKLGFHNLRHTFVTHLKIGGAMDSVAKELAGHGSNAVSAPSLTCEFNIIVTSNSRLVVHLEGDVSAWQRRLKIISYGKAKPANAIPDLDKQILKNESPGVLNWMLDGLYALRSANWQLALSPVQKSRVDELLLESDSVNVFFAERCVADSTAEGLTITDAFAAYSDFCAERGWTGLNRNLFGHDCQENVQRIFRVTLRHDITGSDGKKNQRGWKNFRLLRSNEEKPC